MYFGGGGGGGGTYSFLDLSSIPTLKPFGYLALNDYGTRLKFY